MDTNSTVTNERSLNTKLKKNVLANVTSSYATPDLPTRNTL